MSSKVSTVEKNILIASEGEDYILNELLGDSLEDKLPEWNIAPQIKRITKLTETLEYLQDETTKKVDLLIIGSSGHFNIIKEEIALIEEIKDRYPDLKIMIHASREDEFLQKQYFPFINSYRTSTDQKGVALTVSTLLDPEFNLPERSKIAEEANEDHKMISDLITIMKGEDTGELRNKKIAFEGESYHLSGGDGAIKSSTHFVSREHAAFLILRDLNIFSEDYLKRLSPIIDWGDIVLCDNRDY